MPQGMHPQGMPPQGMPQGMMPGNMPNMLNMPPRGFPPGGPRGPMPNAHVQMQRPVNLGMGPGNPMQALQQGPFKRLLFNFKPATASILFCFNIFVFLPFCFVGMQRPGMQMPPGMQGPTGGPPGMVSHYT